MTVGRKLGFKVFCCCLLLNWILQVLLPSHSSWKISNFLSYIQAAIYANSYQGISGRAWFYSFHEASEQCVSNKTTIYKGTSIHCRFMQPLWSLKLCFGLAIHNLSKHLQNTFRLSASTSNILAWSSGSLFVHHKKLCNHGSIDYPKDTVTWKSGRSGTLRPVLNS